MCCFCAGFLIPLVLLPIFFALQKDLQAEYIFLKDGNVIKGAIRSDGADYIAVTVEGVTRKIQRSAILRILYTDITLGKVYIQKRDGTSVVAYIVDEDRIRYVCRRELYSAREFLLNRTDVLFIAEKNPSGLKGTAGMTEVSLSWFPPYDPVKKYNIYMKTAKNGEYHRITSSSGRHATIENLKSNTLYYFIVKSVDSEDYESSPSNQLKLVTKNIPPVEPEESFTETRPDGKKVISWTAATDPDGTIRGYRIYRVSGMKTEIMAFTSKTEYVIPPGKKFYRIFIRSLDDRNTESTGSTPVYFGPRPEFNVSLEPAFVLPMDNLARQVKAGYGAVLHGGISNYFISGLDLGGGISFLYFPGKDRFTEPENSVKSLIMIPLVFSAGYTFYPYKALRISSRVCAGFPLCRRSIHISISLHLKR